MDGQNYLVFHTAAADSYMNSSANFRGADVGATFIDLYFQSATAGQAGSAYDKVRLTVTAVIAAAPIPSEGKLATDASAAAHVIAPQAEISRCI